MAAQDPQVDGSEQMTVTALEPLITPIWATLKRYAPRSLRLNYKRGIDASIDCYSSAVSMLPGCRPDSYVIINGRLGMCGEYKVYISPFLAAAVPQAWLHL